MKTYYRIISEGKSFRIEYRYWWWPLWGEITVKGTPFVFGSVRDAEEYVWGLILSRKRKVVKYVTPKTESEL